MLFSTAGRLRPYEWKEAEGKGLGESILTFLGNAVRSSEDETGAFYSVQCGYEHCRSGFFAPSDLHRIPPASLPRVPTTRRALER